MWGGLFALFLCLSIESVGWLTKNVLIYEVYLYSPKILLMIWKLRFWALESPTNFLTDQTIRAFTHSYEIGFFYLLFCFIACS